MYPNIEDKAAAFLESIVKNHPFIDGNKRTGYILMRYLLLTHGKDIHATEDEKYEFIISIAAGNLTIDEMRQWVRDHVKLRQK